MSSGRRAVVVIPACDERDRIAGCLRALAVQSIGGDAFTVVLVLDRCTDDTAAVALASARATGMRLVVMPGRGAGVGAARRAGMDLACELLAGTPNAGDRGLIACTDADSAPAPDWLERQLDHVAGGARAIGGLVELDAGEAAELPAPVLVARREQAARRLRAVRQGEPHAGHHHFAGASLGVTVGAYRHVGGIAPWPVLEDAAFARRLQRHGIPLLRACDVRVATSARLDGRAPRGLARDLAAFVREAGDAACCRDGGQASAASRS